jgi:hypothetical protein
MTHVCTSPSYQNRTKIERRHKSLNLGFLQLRTPLSLDDERREVSGYVDHYNNVRLNSATGYIPPRDMLAERLHDIWRSATGSWGRSGSIGSSVASKPLEAPITLCWLPAR